MELFLDVFNISQYQHGLVISKQSFRRNIHIQHAVAPQCHDIYIIFLSDVQFSNRFSDPGIRNGNFKNAMFFI